MDGIGFDATKQHSAGHGLVTMRRRAGEMAASIDLTTGTHRGTAVVVRSALGWSERSARCWEGGA